MRATAILLFMSLLYFYSLAFPHGSSHTRRIKRTDKAVSEHSASNRAKRTATTSTTTLDDISNDCEESADSDSHGDRKRRFVRYNLESITTTETPLEDTTDISILSQEFFNCLHISVEPGCYEKLPNGSVIVPMYNMQFNRSNYFILHRILYLCPDFYYSRITEFLNFSETTTTNDVRDYCKESVAFDSNTVRNRRSIHYYLENETTTETTSEATVDISLLSQEFLNCTHIYVEPGCYEKLSNGSVLVPMYNMHFNSSDYLINNQLLFICPEFFTRTTEHKFSENFPLVSFICAAISTVCISLHVIMFIFVKNLRNLPGYCLLSLCFALIGAYICVFIQYDVEVNFHQCIVLGMSMMYLFLASFFWMNVMAYDVWKSIRMATSKLRLTSSRAFAIQYLRYSLYAWGTPLMIIIISIIVHYLSPEVSEYKLAFDENTCWFKYKTALTTYFAGPMIVLIGLNVLLFASSFYMISNASMSKSQTNNQGSSDLWSRLFLSLRLGSVMGFMWIFGFIAAITKQVWIWYLFSVCSALQGVFIFFSFTVSERTRKACKNVIQKRKFSSTPTQSSSQPGTSF